MIVIKTQSELDAAIVARAAEIKIGAELVFDFRLPDDFRPVIRTTVNAVLRFFAGRPHVVAWESSQPHVEAWGSSQPHVEAWGSSQPHVVARESSQPHVEAWGSSQPHVVAWGYVALRIRGLGIKATAAAGCSVHLHQGATCEGGVQIPVKEPETVAELCEWYGVDQSALPKEVDTLDKIREIVLSNPRRLEMGHWHASDWKPDRSACDETECGTTHCMAGWAQVLCEDPTIRKLDAEIAGKILIPSAAGMFTATNKDAERFLRGREYVK